ncbi:hypothetical protein [Streptomyces malaysiensis]|uniref:Uncharacterized protein n=1 Tax=Streptomyces malaysiensis subsp. samsunensis TaxID=459658 RepID=A0A9X2RTL6_STRMQ|nr:hypothetical protein [Streptomyces samsunensis]MCQ8829873.1 hypothetical protein [Streptomyces samsunensis]
MSGGRPRISVSHVGGELPIWLHFQGLKSFEELSTEQARHLVFDLAEVLGLRAYDPALLGEEAE